MTTSYVEIVDHAGKSVALFDAYRSLSWGHKLNAPGYFTLVIWGDDDRVVYLKKNYIVNIYRQPLGQTAFYLEFSGLITDFDYQWWENDNSQVTVSGVSMTGLLSRRIIDYTPNTPQAKKSGFCEDVARSYVSQNCGTEADSSNRRSGSGLIPGFAVIPSMDYAGTYWQGDRSGENLLKVVQEIAQHSESLGLPLRFGVSFAKNPGIEFYFAITSRAYNQDRSALDISPVTGKNPSGNAPIVFAREMGNISSLSESYYGTEANVLVVVGADNDGEVPFVSVQADDYDNDPLNLGRYERQIDGREAVTPAMLSVIGTEWLGELKQKDESQFVPIVQRGSMYGIDWGFGDVVSYIKNDRTVVHKQIVSVSVQYDSQGVEAVSVEIGNLNFGRR